MGVSRWFRWFSLSSSALVVLTARLQDPCLTSNVVFGSSPCAQTCLLCVRVATCRQLTCSLPHLHTAYRSNCRSKLVHSRPSCNHHQTDEIRGSSNDSSNRSSNGSWHGKYISYSSYCICSAADALKIYPPGPLPSLHVSWRR